jgi:hypothetical protein
MFSSGWLVVFDGGVLITIAYIYIYMFGDFGNMINKKRSASYSLKQNVTTHRMLNFFLE